jgi:aryl-alcohol dehydrogenase-like predicted oxidoreductase
MTFGGTGNWGRLGATGVEDARRQIDMCLDAGINLIDTANVYSLGASEAILGEALGDERRKRALIATKVRFAMGKGMNDAGLSRHHIVAECEASLRRLRTDHIDLYQVHQWDGQTDLEETVRALDTLVEQGKVRYIGCSNYSAWHIMKALAASERLGAHHFVSEQIHYTLHAREAEFELIPAAIDQGLGVLVWSPLGGGLLSGKYRRDDRNPEGTRRFAGWGAPPVYSEEKLFDIVDALLKVSNARGVAPAQVAIAWLIGRPGITSAIIGARNDDQLKVNLGAADLKLSAEERAELDAASLPDLPYPYWHQARNAKDRLGPADLSFLPVPA